MRNLIFFNLLQEDELLHEIKEDVVTNSTPFRPLENKSNAVDQPPSKSLAAKGPNSSTGQTSMDKENLEVTGSFSSSI